MDWSGKLGKTLDMKFPGLLNLCGILEDLVCLGRGAQGIPDF